VYSPASEKEVKVKHVREQDLETIGTPAPNARTLKHLAAPWTNGAHVWIGLTEFGPGVSSNPGAHEGREEVFYVLSGSGVIEVEGEQAEVGPGSVVVAGPGETHSIANTGTELLRMVCCVSPPFEQSEFAHAKPLADAGG
jgi:mannose-6-phosphate isomerase-like protein (cupin superfamily)